MIKASNVIFVKFEILTNVFLVKFRINMDNNLNVLCDNSSPNQYVLGNSEQICVTIRILDLSNGLSNMFMVKFKTNMHNNLNVVFVKLKH